jgi:hypothetical protein
MRGVLDCRRKTILILQGYSATPADRPGSAEEKAELKNPGKSAGEKERMIAH